MRETSTYIVKQALTKRETSKEIIYIRNASLNLTKRQRENLFGKST